MDKMVNMTSLNNSGVKDKVLNYYLKTLIDYKLIYFLKGIRAMNYGYWDSSVRNRKGAYSRLNEVISSKLQLTKDSHVLDAGCGMGDCSFWIVQNIGATVKGISIAPNQIKIAKKTAVKKGLENKTSFVTGDYTDTKYVDETFDAVFAIETICHLEDKGDFYKEMFRILKPGGRLTISEYVLTNKKLSKKDTNELKLMLEGWAIPNLWTLPRHTKSLLDVGFTNTVSENYSDKVKQVGKYIAGHAVYGIPIYWALNKIGLINNTRLKDAISCKYQWRTMKNKVWSHHMISATKPLSIVE